MTRKGFDKRTGKPVVIVGEVAGHNLFSGLKNKRLTKAQMAKLASKLVKLCRENGIRPTGLGLSLITLGYEILAESRRVKHG